VLFGGDAAREKKGRMVEPQNICTYAKRKTKDARKDQRYEGAEGILIPS